MPTNSTISIPTFEAFKSGTPAFYPHGTNRRTLRATYEIDETWGFAFIRIRYADSKPTMKRIESSQFDTYKFENFLSGLQQMQERGLL